MPTMRTIGLVAMAALTASVGLAGYISFQAISAERAAREALLAVGQACDEVIASGSPRMVEITIPVGYSMKFEDNQIYMAGQRYPSDGFGVRFFENLALEAGPHTLSISISAHGLVISRTS
ncbi:MAG: hypothetical protein ACK4GQ_04575 [Candidatus Hadarchaeales archaeon]